MSMSLVGLMFWVFMVGFSFWFGGVGGVRRVGERRPRGKGLGVTCPPVPGILRCRTFR